MIRDVKRVGLAVVAVAIASVTVMATVNTAGAAGKQPAIKGVITAMPLGRTVGTWTIGGIPVRVTNATRVQLQGSPLAVGSCTEVKTMNTNGVLSAIKIETKPAAICSPALQTPQMAAGDVQREDRQEDHRNDDNGRNRGPDDKGGHHDDTSKSDDRGGN